ncbi:hypothetical protein HK405_008515 [Cladochytrium tenue]|nr:hypothetical protein HK405_008515 [Cladochytrium tenue]
MCSVTHRCSARGPFKRYFGTAAFDDQIQFQPPEKSQTSGRTFRSLKEARRSARDARGPSGPRAFQPAGVKPAYVAPEIPEKASKVGTDRENDDPEAAREFAKLSNPIRMSRLRPPDVAGLEAALARSDRAGAWLKYVDICLSEDNQKLLKVAHVAGVLKLLAARKPKPIFDLADKAAEYAARVGLRLDTACYNHLILSHARAGSFDGAARVMAEMVQAPASVAEDGSSVAVSPDADTYDAMMEAYVCTGQHIGASTFLDRMREEGVLPRTSTYNILVEGFARMDRPARAKEYLQEMVDAGIAWDHRTLNIAIRLNGPSMEPEELEDFLSEPMTQWKLRFNTANVTSLMSVWAKDGLLDQAVRVANDFITAYRDKVADGDGLEAIDPDFVPDTALYTALIDAHIKRNDLPAANRILADMVTQNVEVDSVTVLKFTAGLCAAGHPEEAERLVQKMEDEGLATRAVTSGRSAASFAVSIRNIVLSRYLEDKKITPALRVFDSMRERNLEIPTGVTNRVLRGLAESYEIEKMLQIWDSWLEESGFTVRGLPHPLPPPPETHEHSGPQKEPITPDANSFSIVIESLIRCHNPDRAFSILTAMVDVYKMQPPPDLFVNLVEAHVRARKYVPAAETMVLMRRSFGGGDMSNLSLAKAAAAAVSGGPALEAITRHGAPERLRRVIQAQSETFERVLLELLNGAEEVERLNAMDSGSVFVDGRAVSGEGDPKADGRVRRHVLSDVFMTSLPASLSSDRPMSTSTLLEARQKRILGCEIYRELVAAGSRLQEPSYRAVIRAHHRFGDLVSAVKTWSAFRAPVPVGDGGAPTAPSPTQPEPDTVTVLLECVLDVGKSGSAKAMLDMVRRENLPLDARGRAAMLCMMAKYGWASEVIGGLVDAAAAADSPTAASSADSDSGSGGGVTRELVSEVMRHLRACGNPGAERLVAAFLEEHFPAMLDAGALGGTEGVAEHVSDGFGVAGAAAGSILVDGSKALVERPVRRPEGPGSAGQRAHNGSSGRAEREDRRKRTPETRQPKRQGSANRRPGGG